MRILYANKFNFLKGGVETILFSEMEWMKDNGHEVAMFSSKDPKNRPSKYSEIFVERMDFQNSGFINRVKSAFNIIYSLESARKFQIVIEDFKPDIIHIHSIYAHLSTSILDVAIKYKIPIIMTVHDYKLVCPNYMLLNHGVLCKKCIGHQYYNCLLTKCHKDSYLASAVNTIETYFNYFSKKYQKINQFISPSEFMKNILMNTINHEKITVLRNAIDLKKYTFGNNHEGYYLFTGRLSSEKGLGKLIQVFKELKFHLKIAGIGPQEEAYKMSAKNNNNIEFLGHLEGQNLIDAYKNAYACIVPSEWYENAPLSVIEPLAFGKPVIGADIGGIRELINDEINGMLFKAFDAADLKMKICRMNEMKSEDYRSMCLKAREFAISNFSSEKHYEQLLEVYSENIKKSRPTLKRSL